MPRFSSNHQSVAVSLIVVHLADLVHMWLGQNPAQQAVYMYVNTYTYVYKQMHIHTYIYISIFIQIYVHINTCRYTYTYLQRIGAIEGTVEGTVEKLSGGISTVYMPQMHL